MVVWFGFDGIVGGFLELVLRGCWFFWGGLSFYFFVCFLVGGRGEILGVWGGVLVVRWFLGILGWVF